MGFFNFAEEKRAKRDDLGKVSVETLHAARCKACPLAQYHKHLCHPDMQPTGSSDPIVYLLGEAPGKHEDEVGRQFVGKAGKLLRRYLPKGWEDKLRWNNCVRTRPPGNRTPTQVEIECCRPSIVEDIEATKPKAILGFGNVPLYWALGQSGITKWCGRRVPIKVGKHKCWFFPMLHPSHVQRSLRKFADAGGYKSDIEFQFALDMRRAFKAINTGLPEPIVHDEKKAREGVDIITGSEKGALKRVLSFLASLYNETIVGLDYETNCRRPYSAGSKILTVALSSKGSTLALALHHREAGWKPEELEAIERAFKQFLHKAPCRKVAHFLAFELEWTGYFFGRGCLHGSKWGDSATQALLLDERMKMGKPDALSLEFLCLQYFGLNVKALAGSLDRKKLDSHDLREVLLYNGLDAKYGRALYKVQQERLKAEGLLDVYREFMKRPPSLVLTQLKGLPVDQAKVAYFEKQYSKTRDTALARLARLRSVKKFRELTGKELSPFENKTVLEYFAWRGKKLSAADETSISKAGGKAAELILTARKANKNYSTYVKPLLPDSPHIYPDKLLHPIISSTTTRTSRTSSEDPNIQNFPKRKTKEVRAQIAPGPGYKVVSFDYGQIQARNVGMESLDKALLKAFWDDYDIHADWTWRVIDKYPRWVPGGRRALKEDKDLFKAKRNDTKNQMVFPSFFGAREKKIAGELKIPIEIAAELLDEFWQMFPDIKGWHEELTAFYFKHGYVTGCTGFRRRAPISPNELINAPIQADEAAIVLDAMYRLSKQDHDYLQASMEIHDDLTFIWEEKRVDELAEIVVREMLDCPFDWANVVPIVVEMSIGDNWAETKEVGKYRSDQWKGKL